MSDDVGPEHHVGISRSLKIIRKQPILVVCKKDDRRLLLPRIEQGTDGYIGSGLIYSRSPFAKLVLASPEFIDIRYCPSTRDTYSPVRYYQSTVVLEYVAAKIKRIGPEKIEDIGQRSPCTVSAK